jgi:2-iminobutanoate/2-iminopropanoate deaminase
MSEITRISDIADIPEPTGPWNWSVSWNGMVFISGIRGIDPKTGQPAPDDETRIKLIFQHMRRILAKAGSAPEAVLSTRVYVTDMGLRPLVNAAYVEAFGDRLPTRTIVEVAGLNQNDSIEIEIAAAVLPAGAAAGRR